MSKNIINYYKIKMDIEHITIQAYGIFINKKTFAFLRRFF